MQTCIWPSWCHCHSLSLASVKSRLVLPIWYRLTRVVPEKRAVKRVCVCVCDAGRWYPALADCHCLMALKEAQSADPNRRPGFIFTSSASRLLKGNIFVGLCESRHRLSTASTRTAFHSVVCSYYAPRRRGHFGIARSVRLSVPWRSCLDYRLAGCLQLSHRRPPETCGLRIRPRTDVDPPRFLDPWTDVDGLIGGERICHRRTAIGGGISSGCPRGDTLLNIDFNVM